MYEVVFLKIIMNLKRELRTASLKNILICSAITLFLGVITALVCGNLRFYYLLILPSFAFSPSFYIIAWSVMYILIGAATGIVIGNCDSCRKRRRVKGLILYAVLLVVSLSWYPTFFSLQAIFIAFLLSLALLVLSYFTMRMNVKVSILSGIIMLIHSLWVAYLVILNFCVLIIN